MLLGYLPRAKHLKRAITRDKDLKNVVSVELKPGTKSSFEVILNDHLMHSKLNGMGWPNPKSLIDEIKAYLTTANKDIEAPERSEEDGLTKPLLEDGTNVEEKSGTNERVEKKCPCVIL